ncbi:hypothetical protein GH714_021223 [Hevea brasiliensis]|uniref:Uncharacterized protein n=1 Tax=Hevea brasiliensis TaxID=3981 RepID=A0A6A6L7B8_HEVBR|nr:hypothetical protein GH714_021223 [Hevea brasiliensis]
MGSRVFEGGVGGLPPDIGSSEVVMEPDKLLGLGRIRYQDDEDMEGGEGSDDDCGSQEYNNELEEDESFDPYLRE